MLLIRREISSTWTISSVTWRPGVRSAREPSRRLQMKTPRELVSRWPTKRIPRPDSQSTDDSLDSSGDPEGPLGTGVKAIETTWTSSLAKAIRRYVCVNWAEMGKQAIERQNSKSRFRNGQKNHLMRQIDAKSRYFAMQTGTQWFELKELVA